jgi:hypothetical protein
MREVIFYLTSESFKNNFIEDFKKVEKTEVGVKDVEKKED